MASTNDTCYAYPYTAKSDDELDVELHGGSLVGRGFTTYPTTDLGREVSSGGRGFSGYPSDDLELDLGREASSSGRGFSGYPSDDLELDLGREASSSGRGQSVLVELDLEASGTPTYDLTEDTPAPAEEPAPFVYETLETFDEDVIAKIMASLTVEDLPNPYTQEYRTFQGLPGAGKTHRAEAIRRKYEEYYAGVPNRRRISVRTTDVLFIDPVTRVYTHDGTKLVAYHTKNREMAIEDMKAGLHVFNPNTNIQNWETREYVKAATGLGLLVKFETLTTKFGSVHDVPPHILADMVERKEPLSVEASLSSLTPWEKKAAEKRAAEEAAKAAAESTNDSCCC
jgi:hypothetical protein